MINAYEAKAKAVGEQKKIAENSIQLDKQLIDILNVAVEKVIEKAENKSNGLFSVYLEVSREAMSFTTKDISDYLIGLGYLNVKVTRPRPEPSFEDSNCPFPNPYEHLKTKISFEF